MREGGSLPGRSSVLRIPRTDLLGIAVDTRPYHNFAPFVRQTDERKAQTCVMAISQQLAFSLPPTISRIHSFVPLARAKKFWDASIFTRPRMSRKTSHVAPRRSIAERHGAEAQKVPLALDRAVCGFRRKLANICRRHSDFRKRTYDVCNRLALVFVYRGCQKGVDDRSRARPGHLHRHTRDLSARIDVASRDYVEVRASGK